MRETTQRQSVQPREGRGQKVTVVLCSRLLYGAQACGSALGGRQNTSPPCCAVLSSCLPGGWVSNGTLAGGHRKEWEVVTQGQGVSDHQVPHSSGVLHIQPVFCWGGGGSVKRTVSRLRLALKLSIDYESLQGSRQPLSAKPMSVPHHLLMPRHQTQTLSHIRPHCSPFQ